MAGISVEVPETVWREVEPLLPVPERRFRYPRRRRYAERACLEELLTVLRWGIPWPEFPQLPGRPSGKTCWRRFDEWQRTGVWPQLVERLQRPLAKTDVLDWETTIVDSTIVLATRRPAKSADTLPISDRPACNLQLVCNGRGAPLAVFLSPVNDHYRRHALAVDRCDPPGCCAADANIPSGCSSTEATTPSTSVPRCAIAASIRGSSRNEPVVIDVLATRKHPNVWTIKRTNAWLHNYRRISTRWERRPELYLAFAPPSRSRRDGFSLRLTPAGSTLGSGRRRGRAAGRRP